MVRRRHHRDDEAGEHLIYGPFRPVVVGRSKGAGLIGKFVTAHLLGPLEVHHDDHGGGRTATAGSAPNTGVEAGRRIRLCAR